MPTTTPRLALIKPAVAGEFIDITLRNKKTGVIEKQGLSKGEQQMYATALLHGLGLKKQLSPAVVHPEVF